MKDAINMAIIGTVVVFAALIVIIICIKIYTGIIAKFENKKNNNGNNGGGKDVTVQPTVNVNPSSSVDELSPELIAVISAAIAASMGSSGIGLQVKSIKRIGHTTPIWNVAGRKEYILSKI